MRLLMICFAAGSLAAASTEAADGRDRAKLIAALERMIVTGEPHHTSHDEGELLQRAVDEALKRADPELERLAMRAAVAIDAQVMRPVISTTDAPPVWITTRTVLKLPTPVRYTAEIFGSVDGGDVVPLGRVEPDQPMPLGGGALPAPARLPGAHHVRLRARITYDPSSGDTVPEPEYRDLPELVYAVFDRDIELAPDARVFLFSPAGVSARQIDSQLPDVPFEYWLNSFLVAHGEDPLHEYNWVSAFCDERTREPWIRLRRLDLCSIFQFQVGGTVGQIWLRTGRIAFSDDDVQWFASTPSFEAVRLIYSPSAETYSLAQLEALLDGSSADWPAPDASVAPQDIAITPVPRRPNTARVSAVIRNQGNSDLQGVFVEIIAGDADDPSTIRHFVRDIPRRGAVTLEVDVTYPRGYGLVLVHAIPSLSDYSAWPYSPPENRTFENNLAFRFINPQRAPTKFLNWVKSGLCSSGKCRGY